jgi:hypothetical protein
VLLSLLELDSVWDARMRLNWRSVACESESMTSTLKLLSERFRRFEQAMAMLLLFLLMSLIVLLPSHAFHGWPTPLAASISS